MKNTEYYRYYRKILQDFCCILNENDQIKREYFVNCKDIEVLEKEIIKKKTIINKNVFYYCAGMACEQCWTNEYDLYIQVAEKFKKFIGLETNKESQKETSPILIGYFEKYRGYTGTIEYNPDDKKHYGRLLLLNCNISYEGKNILELERDFHNVIDRYLELCGDLNLRR